MKLIHMEHNGPKINNEAFPHHIIIEVNGTFTSTLICKDEITP